jgi:acyl-CoA synthetase (NDP forming)
MLTGAVDAGMLVIEYPPSDSPYRDTAAQEAMDRALAAAGRASGKPVFHASVNTGGITAEAARSMIAAGIVPLQGLDDAAQVIAKWVAHCARLRADGGAVPAGLIPHAVGPLTGTPRTVNEAEAKRRLAAHGLAVPEGRVLTLDAIRALPATFAAPMALKVLHDDLPHKTEVGGVALGLATRAEAVAAAERMVASVARHRPGLVLDTFLLEPMQPPPLAELIVGVKRDPLFGMVLVIGAGGIFVDLMKDAATLLLPVTREEVEAALRRLRAFALLDGFRGRARAPLDRIVDAVMAVADYAAANRDRLAELDVNPLMVHEGGAVAVDALIVEAAGPEGPGQGAGGPAKP